MKQVDKLFNDIGITVDHDQPLYIKNVDVDLYAGTWSVHLASDKLITSDYFFEIDRKFNSHFKDKVKNIIITLSLKDGDFKNIDNDKILHYINYFRKKNGRIDSSLSAMRYNVSDAGVNFEIMNSFEQNLLNSCLPLLKQEFGRIGIRDINFNVSKANDDVAKAKMEEIFAKREKELETPVIKAAPKVKMAWGDDISSRKSLPLKEVVDPHNMINNAVFEGVVFDLELREFPKTALLTFMVADEEGTTMTCKSFTGFMGKPPTLSHLSQIRKGMVVKVAGKRTYDKFVRDEVIEISSVLILDQMKPFTVREDTSPVKRTELHVHSKMSKNNGISSMDDYAKLAKHFGHDAIAVSDHHGVQAFVEAESVAKRYGLKIIYGVETTIVDDPMLCFNSTEALLSEQTYTVFDVETTGLSANMNKLIEIGATKLKDGLVVDSYQTFIKIDEPLSAFTTELTGITDEDLETGQDLKDALLEFKKFCDGTVLVAHNAKFDMQFMNANYKRELNYVIDNPVIDTLEVSRFINKDRTYHTLKILSKHYGVALDSSSHHRADYDAEKTAEMFDKMLVELNDLGITTLTGLNEANDVNKSRGTHVLIYVKTQEALRDLYELVSLSNVETFHMEPRMLRSEIERLRENLIICSSGCQNGDIIDAYLNATDDELKKRFDFYDFIEILPPAQYVELIENGTFKDLKDVEVMHKRLIEIANNKGIKVVANGNAHFTEPNLYSAKEIIMAKDFKATKTKKNKEGIEEFIDKIKFKKLVATKKLKYQNQYFKTTDEMLEEFSYLDEATRQEVVVTNTNIIKDMVDVLKIIPDDLFTPEIEGVDDKLVDMVYEYAYERYGKELPQIIIDRLNKEVNSITKYGFSVIYYISHKLVKHSLDNGYLVGSRGSVGSSLVATFMEITEVNPLPPHYVCPTCKESEWILDGSFGSGYDLPIKNCPTCDVVMIRDGQDIPFETFLGFEGDKVPDIDLNFSGEFQGQAFEFVRSRERLNDPELFDYAHAFRAGTIGTIAEKTAFAYVRNYFELLDMPTRKSDILYVSKNLDGIKRTTGQHPGGIIVVPTHREIYEFTPIAFPAEDTSQPWKTTHFDFHAIHDNLLKLDILGHDDPTMLKRLYDLTGIDPKYVNITDPKVMELFSGTTSLDVDPEQIMSDLGTQGVPEFGTGFVMEMLKDTKPSTFSELVQISGLSHGTDVWLGNAKDLIDDGTCELKDVIGCRDDIMVYLMYQGLQPSTAFTIMEKVRKGKGVSDDEIAAMKKEGVPDWYIESCQKIKYMFPKAHAAAYVLMALRIAYYKVYHPIQYYAAYFSSRVNDFDAPSMIRGSESLKNKIEMISNFEDEMSDVKRKSILNSLKMSLEMVERGFTFDTFNIEKSDAFNFIVNDEGTGLIMPFSTIDGLGEKEAIRIVEEREAGPFMTKEDFKKRTKVKKKSFTQLEVFNVFEGLEEDNQVSLF
ncbi:PolC-type DNA polymerase III [Mollicutes bacterium LVI A0039]|nr:PolC-type DNA polymerase III [Mollicutes bacterium LVI A0039]